MVKSTLCIQGPRSYPCPVEVQRRTLDLHVPEDMNGQMVLSDF